MPRSRPPRRFDQFSLSELANVAAWAAGTVLLFVLGHALRVVDDQLVEITDPTD